MSSWVLNRSLIFKLLRENSAEVCFMRYRTLCKSILKCGFPIKGIKLTWFILFEVLGVPWFWGTSVETISVGTAPEFAKYKWGNGTRDFSVLDKLVRLCIWSQHRVFPLPWWYFPVWMEGFRQKILYCTTSRSDNF